MRDHDRGIHIQHHHLGRVGAGDLRGRHTIGQLGPGARYEVIGTGLHSETEDPFVYYRLLYGDRSFWVRPLAMFTEHVERGDYAGPRFRKVD